MRAVFGLVLVLGMGLAGFAVYMVKGYVGQTQSALVAERERAAQAVETVEVYALNRAIAYGEELTMEDVTKIRYAKPYLPDGTFTSEEVLFPDAGESPRTVTRPMEINEPVLAAKVSEPGEIITITSLLDPGMRAFTIKVDVQSGVSGFLRPGDYVDIYWSGTVNRGAGTVSRGVTQLIKSAVELIAVDQTADGNRNGAEIARTVTVQVTPQDVAALAQAQATGNLSLSLVGRGDITAAATDIQVDLNSLLGIVEEAPAPEPVAQAPAPAPQVCTIRTRRGADVVEIPIPCTN
ncbi:Flp pilus assembly protein CpaB [Yoonia sp. 208BN28-4]|uniref:Flp pilus assembly protein CpaB n=1 Tax=Yoonia sp. 208BN28-4 TaxID=3126505 RepID=UPI0030B71567